LEGFLHQEIWTFLWFYKHNRSWLTVFLLITSYNICVSLWRP
jgi:hypothetical protein